MSKDWLTIKGCKYLLVYVDLCNTVREVYFFDKSILDERMNDKCFKAFVKDYQIYELTPKKQ